MWPKQFADPHGVARNKLFTPLGHRNCSHAGPISIFLGRSHRSWQGPTNIAKGEGAYHTTLRAYSAYDLPSVESLVRYFHAAARFPIIYTWLNAIKEGNYRTWTGLTQNNVTSYCSPEDDTIKGHMVQSWQGVRSTKPKKIRRPIPSIFPDDLPLPFTASNELHMHTVHIRNIYTYDMGRFPVKARSGNQYLMVA